MLQVGIFLKFLKLFFQIFFSESIIQNIKQKYQRFLILSLFFFLIFNSFQRIDQFFAWIFITLRVWFVRGNKGTIRRDIFHQSSETVISCLHYFHSGNSCAPIRKWKGTSINKYVLSDWLCISVAFVQPTFWSIPGSQQKVRDHLQAHRHVPAKELNGTCVYVNVARCIVD